MKLYRMLALPGLVLGVVAAANYGQSGGGYDLSWNTLDGGGGTSAGGGFTLTGTVGQHDAGTSALTGGNYELNGGFWFGVNCPLDIPADYDLDCDVDQDDYTLFEVCASGPTVAHDAGCADRDFDLDGDVDNDDFGDFQTCFSGAGIVGDPNCPA